jgi:hypothetical protein
MSRDRTPCAKRSMYQTGVISNRFDSVGYFVVNVEGDVVLL